MDGLHSWMHFAGTTHAEVFSGDVILPKPTIDHINEMNRVFCWRQIMRSTHMWTQKWENSDSIQQMLTRLSEDIWIHVRDGGTLWNMESKQNADLKGHMRFYDDTVAGRRAAELYYRAGMMVVYTFHPDFISNGSIDFKCLVEALVIKWGVDNVATAKIKSSRPNWNIVMIQK